MTDFKYALLYDFHTSAQNPDVGKNFDAEKITDEMKKCGVDFLTWHARCNQGGCYFPTKYGIMHPSLKRDLFGELSAACKRKGIRLSAYMNASLSDLDALAHRDWMCIRFDGTTYDKIRVNPLLRTLCYNSPHREQLKNLALELIDKYDVDGFFFDCFFDIPCICPTCVAEMKKLGYDYTNEKDVTKFAHFSAMRLCRYLSEAVRARKKDAYLFYNCSDYEEISDAMSHLECECLPTAGWGYEYLPTMLPYMRPIAGERPILNMTGRFYNWGDFGGLRKAASIEYDLYYGIANGARPDVGGHFHPRGDMDQPVFDVIREIYNRMQKLDKWVLGAKNRPEVGVVYPKTRKEINASVSLKGVSRLLNELKIPFNTLTKNVNWEGYRLLICPDDVYFTEETAAKIRKHLDQGGALIASHESGLDPEKKGFVLPGWPVTYQGVIAHNPLFFKPEGKFAEGLQNMNLSVYASGSNVRASENADVEMYDVKPYFNAEFDGVYSHYYEAPDCKTEEPLLVFKDRIAYISAEWFKGYMTYAAYQHRILLGNVIHALLPEPKFRSETLPCYARAFVQEKENLELLHLLAYVPEARGKAIALEEGVTLMDSVLELRTDGRKVRRVYLAPDEKTLEFSIKGAYCRILLPRMDAHALIVVEYEK